MSVWDIAADMTHFRYILLEHLIKRSWFIYLYVSTDGTYYHQVDSEAIGSFFFSLYWNHTEEYFKVLLHLLAFANGTSSECPF